MKVKVNVLVVSLVIGASFLGMRARGISAQQGSVLLSNLNIQWIDNGDGTGTIVSSGDLANDPSQGTEILVQCRRVDGLPTPISEMSFLPTADSSHGTFSFQQSTPIGNFVEICDDGTCNNLTAHCDTGPNSMLTVTATAMSADMETALDESTIAMPIPQPGTVSNATAQ